MVDKTFEIRVRGVVQGVGFRPFIYKLANGMKLVGEVLNDTEGVLIRLNSQNEIIAKLEIKIKNESPPLSKIDSIETKEIEYKEFSRFEVVESECTDEKSVFIPPDTSICEDCKVELFDMNNHRFNFPFINCTNCGPRFGIIRDIPYDREKTSMKKFPMCKRCNAEYDDPADRRFHTEPTSCPVCGPKYYLYNNKKELLSENINKIISELSSLLKNGAIIAIKGEGGYHLAANAQNSDAVKILRERKQRPFKPFALMVKNIEIAEKFLNISDEEKSLLLSKERPIVILKKKREFLSNLIAPGLTYLGVMLPYSPIQHLIFNSIGEMILVMTSGNISNEPIISDEKELFEKLIGVADYFITSNREIVQQSDDSVLFVNNNSPYMIRRAKGFVPLPIVGSHSDSNFFAAGSDIKNSFALSKENLVFLSQYIGDLASPLTEKIYKRTIDHYKNLFMIEPEIFVSDLHPGYFSTKITDMLWHGEGKRIKVQHHHAHISAVLEENNVNEKVLGVSFDGTGYGEDGNIWGGEFFIADKKEYSRVGYFDYFPLPGGDTAVKEIWRIGLSLAASVFGKDPFPSNEKRVIVTEMIKKKINSPLCCSVGRLFDGVSSILGFSDTISTEAEAAQLLEEAALRSDSLLVFPLKLKESNGGTPIVIDYTQLIGDIVLHRQKGISSDDLARIFHNSIADVTVKVLKKLREIGSINKVALSGGVFQNRLLLNMVISGLQRENFTILLPKELPFNDGAIAFGQIVSAKAILKSSSLQ